MSFAAGRGPTGDQATEALPAPAEPDGSAEGAGPAGRTPGGRGGPGGLARRAAPPLLAAATGVLPVLIFPTVGWWWFAYVCLVPLMLVLRAAPTARRAMVLGWWGGVGFLVGVMSWLIPTLSVAILALAGLLGLFWAPWGWLVWRLLRGVPAAGRAAAAVVLVPCGWLAIETIRSWQYLGGPWGLLGASQYRQHTALVLASVGGVWLDSLVVVAVNTAVVVLIGARGRSAIAYGAVGALVVSAFAALAWAPQPRLTGRTAVVAVVQPGGTAGLDARTERGERLTRQLIGTRPDLVVWGESSLGYDLATRPDLVGQLAVLSRQVGADLLVNVDAARPNGAIYKSSVLVDPQGLTGQRYDKIRLVPFGEYIPMRPVLGWISSLSKAAAVDRRRGDTPVLMTVPEPDGATLRIGPLVCFESAFPDMSRALVRKGAQLVVIQSSTSTFQDTSAPEQHASLAAFRAAETGRPVVQATLTGVSAAYDPQGREVGHQLGTDFRGTASYAMPLASGSTLYDRWGNWVPLLCCLLLAVAGVGALLLARRRRAS